MKIKESASRRIFMVCNFLFLTAAGLVCLLPFINLLAISFSGQLAVSLGEVTFWPKDFTLKSYSFVIENSKFIRALLISVARVALGLVVNLTLIVLTAYPLSKGKDQFRARNIYSWFFVITILFSGGVIPTFMVVRYTGLMNNILSLILPGALPVFSMLVVMNFMRSLPKELEEAAFIDGASHTQTLFRIILPVSTPALATVALFSIVYHWNAWFDGMLYMQRAENLPLQTYLRTVIIDPVTFFTNAAARSSELAEMMQVISPRTVKSAQLFIATLPVLIIYPFLQKYFTSGLVMGSVKG